MYVASILRSYVRITYVWGAHKGGEIMGILAELFLLLDTDKWVLTRVCNF